MYIQAKYLSLSFKIKRMKAKYTLVSCLIGMDYNNTYISIEKGVKNRKIAISKKVQLTMV